MISRQRILLHLAMVFLLAGIGASTGLVLARQITMEKTDEQLQQYADQLISDAETSRDELHTTLAAVEASGNNFCSDAEIRYLRALIFESEFIRDAGRIGGGKLQCSAGLGRLPMPKPMPRADFMLQDGSAFYHTLSPYQNNGVPMLVLTEGSAYVVFSPLVRMHQLGGALHFVETTIDAPTQTQGPLFGESLPYHFATEGTAHLGELLTATRCSIRHFSCMTAHTTLHEAIHANRGKFTSCIVLCTLSGALFGLFGMLLLRRNQSLEQQLRRALKHERLRVVYQPIVALGSGHMVGAEALARWKDEQGNNVPPDKFVRLAEEHGFVGELTRVVLRKALRDFGTTLRSDSKFRLSINISSADLSDESFLPFLDELLARTSVSPSSLAIEITESSTARYRTAIDAIMRLRQRGFDVHIDDFGTGYSSLAYLHDLSVDAIKIDRAFTQGIGTGSALVAIVPQILAMAEALDLEVIVEGIENEEQAAYFTASNRAMLGQGWLFGKPVSAAALHDHLAADRTRSKSTQNDRTPRETSTVVSSNFAA